MYKYVEKVFLSRRRTVTSKMIIIYYYDDCFGAHSYVDTILGTEKTSK